MLDGPGDLRERDGREFCAVEMLRESFGLTVRAAYIFPSVVLINRNRCSLLGAFKRERTDEAALAIKEQRQQEN